MLSSFAVTVRLSAHLLLLAALPLGSALAAEAFPLELRDPWVRTTPPGAGAAAGYGVLHNVSDQPVRIAELQSPLSRRVEIHEMRFADGQMRMRALPLPQIEAGAQMTLEPGGNHFMFTGLNTIPAAGDEVRLTVELEDGNSATFVLPVRDASSGSTGHTHH